MPYMNDESEFNKLRSKIASYLKARLFSKSRESGGESRSTGTEAKAKHSIFHEPDNPELGPEVPLVVPAEPPKNIEPANLLEIPSKVTSKYPPPFKEPLDKEQIAFYRERIERAFAHDQTATTPWIKLGVDLGTSSSKVVWRGESNVFPVCFGDDPLRLESYLMPSVVRFIGHDLFFGSEGQHVIGASTVSNFKMCLACVGDDTNDCGTARCSLTSWPIDLFCDELDSVEIQFVNACYLGKLLSTTKQIIVNDLAKDFRHTVFPKWTANLAVPEIFIEQSPVASEFRSVLRTGWLMAGIFSEQPSLKDRKSLFECFVAARELASESLEVLSDEEFGCSIYPEVGAEVSSIVMSRLSEPGLYAFVDIGAGTVDASVFNYFREKDGRPNRPPWAASVSKELGAAQIEIQASSVKGVPFSIAELKGIKETYNAMSTEERSGVNQQFRVIKYVVGQLKPKIQSFLQDVLRKARDEKDPRLVNEKIRLVVGGGGSRLNTYKDAAVKAFTFKHKGAPKTELTTLEKPNDFQMPMPAEDFHRFAVAYGLSYPVSDLPEMVFPKDVLKRVDPKKKDKNYGSIYEK